MGGRKHHPAWPGVAHRPYNGAVHQPTDITLKRDERVLVVTFDDGRTFELPNEYLRVYSPSAEVSGHGPGQWHPPTGRERIKIMKIEPVGAYAVCLHFADGHKSGIYSWETLYDLGVNFERYWEQYLREMDARGYERKV